MLETLLIRLKTIFSTKSIWVYYIIPFLLLTFIRIWLVYKSNQPWLIPDEFRQLGHARYLAGGEHLLFINVSYTNFGYGLLITPLFWIFSEPVSIYKAVIIFNSIFSSFLYFPLFYILRKVGNLSQSVAAVIALTVSFYPAYILQNMLAYHDAVLPVFYVLSIALCIYLFSRTTYFRIILFSINIGFLYTLHVRTLPIVLIVSLAYLFLVFRSKINKSKYFLGLLIILSIFIITKNVNTFFIENNWVNPANYTISSTIGLLNTWPGWQTFLIRLMGQLLYLIQATYGLFIFGALFIIDYFIQNRKKIINNYLAIGLIYVLLTSLGTLLTSSLYMASPHLNRPDIFIYGRYNEIYLSIYIALGILYLYNKKKYKISYVFVGVYLLIASFIIEQKYHPDLLVGSVKSNITGISFWLFTNIHANLFYVSLVVFLFLIVLSKLLHSRFKMGISVLFILFLINSIFYSNLFFRHRNEIDNRSNILVNEIKKLNIKKISYEYNSIDDTKNIEDISVFSNKNFYNFQWQLPQVEFHLFSGDLSEVPQYNYVVSNSLWSPPENIEAEIITKDYYGVQNLWKINNRQ